MDKIYLLEQLTTKLEAAAGQAVRFAAEAQNEAQTGAGRAVNLAKATKDRALAAQAALAAVNGFKPRAFRRNEPIGVGALVEVEDGETGKTLFLAPAGAGEELTGPGGDGVFFVVSPAAPLGKALLGKRVGDVVETMIRGELTEWTITFAE